ncbi:MAG TPA: SDR family oxidoreductase [Symbiobacteriaceae bacterium]|jgi:3-oxoacyl-[acyl-carrier protein] reductase
MELAGKVAIITGGGTGLGRAVTLGLAMQGVDVAINYAHSEADAADTAKEAEALGVRAIILKADMGNGAEIDAMARHVEERLGRIDILVANAGTTVFVPMNDLDGVSEADWDKLMNVNVKGPWLCAKAVAPAMKRAGGGRIVTVSSIAGLQPMGSSMPYCVSKAALIHLTRCLATALAPDVLVNTVAPGLLETRWNAGHSPETRKKFHDSTLLKRIATVEDTADQVLSLIKTGSMTGQTIIVDGGTIFSR